MSGQYNAPQRLRGVSSGSMPRGTWDSVQYKTPSVYDSDSDNDSAEEYFDDASLGVRLEFTSFFVAFTK